MLLTTREHLLYRGLLEVVWEFAILCRGDLKQLFNDLRDQVLDARYSDQVGKAGSFKENTRGMKSDWPVMMLVPVLITDGNGHTQSSSRIVAALYLSTPCNRPGRLSKSSPEPPTCPFESSLGLLNSGSQVPPKYL